MGNLQFTELINQVMPLFGHHSYIKDLLTYVVDMPYSNNSCSLKEFNDELRKEINRLRTLYFLWQFFYGCMHTTYTKILIILSRDRSNTHIHIYNYSLL